MFAEKLRVGGFLSHGFIKSSHYNYLVDSEEGDFDFAEVALNFTWNPAERTTVNGQVFAFELGNYGNFEPLIDYLFLEYVHRKELGFRVGAIKREFGLYTHIQDVDVARPTILLPAGMYDQRNRDFSASLDGISQYGRFDFWDGHSLDYNVYGGFNQMDPEGGVAGFALTNLSRSLGNPVLDYVDSEYLYGVSFWYHPKIEGFRIGYSAVDYLNISLSSRGTIPEGYPVSYLVGQEIRSTIDDLDMRYESLAFDYFVGNWNVVGEYVWSNMRMQVVSDIGGQVVSIEDANLESHSWYTGIARRFNRLEAAIGYTDYRGDNLGDPRAIPDHAQYHKDIQLSLRYDVTDFWTIKAEHHSIKGTSRLFNQFKQNPVLDQESWSLWALKSTFYF